MLHVTAIKTLFLLDQKTSTKAFYWVDAELHLNYRIISSHHLLYGGGVWSNALHRYPVTLSRVILTHSGVLAIQFFASPICHNLITI